MKLVQHVLGGAAVFGAAVWGGFSWAKSGQQREAVVAAAGAQRAASGAAAHGGGRSTADDGTSDDGSCAFDRLADAYDGIVGAEERGMFMGLLRWWLLRGAEGDVLEISAGTGRNLPHYPLASMHSLTLTDVSAAMLDKAREKFFDELQLQYKQPGLSCSFMLADAQHMLASGAQPPQAVLLPAGRLHWQQQQRPSSAAARTQPQQQQPEPAEPQSVWRFKKQRLGSADTTSAGGSSEPAAAAPPAAATDGSSPASSSQSTSKGGWRWPAPALTRPCSCREHATDAAADATSSSSGAGMSMFAAQSFDVVVDTFGLCSCSDPVQVLQQAAQLVKPGGKLLLLEHGRSSWDWLNTHMDERAAHHHATYGCWYNRDILGIVQRAGLRVHSCSRWHLGTSYLIVASPPAAAAAGGPAGAATGAAGSSGTAAAREQAARAA